MWPERPNMKLIYEEEIKIVEGKGVCG
jgi:hypothetical protein